MKKYIFLIFTIFFLVSCSPMPTEMPVTLTPVNVCYSALSGTQAVTWYAYEKGLFEKYGLLVNLVSMSGGSGAVSSLVSGDMDICQVASPSVVNAVAANQDIVMIAGLINTVPGSLMTQPEITSPEMLQGRIIGIDLGGSAEALTRLALMDLGIDPDRDVVLLNIGSEPERIAALKARQIDATFINPPLTASMRKKGFVELFNVGAAKIPYQGTSIATTRKFLKENRSLVANFMKAILEAIVRIKSDPEGSKAVMSQYLSLDPVADADALQESYNTIFMDTLGDIPYPTMEGLQVVIDLAAKENPGAALIKPEEVVDTSILEDLEKSGFISGLK